MTDSAEGDVSAENCEDSSVKLVKERDSLLVRDLNPKTTDECVRYYFENRRRSGGGPVNTVQRLDRTSALVTFIHHGNTDSVLAKTQHKLDGSILRVSALQSSRGHLSADCDISIDTSITPDSQNDCAQSPTAVLENTTKSCENSLDTESQTAVVESTTQSSETSQDLKFDFPNTSEFSVTGKTIPNLSLSQLKFLCSRRVIHQLQKQFAGVEIFVNEDTQTGFVKASEDVIKRRFLDLQLLISSVTNTSLSLTPATMKMYDNKDIVKWIQASVIDQSGLMCNWELSDHHLVIYGPKSSLSILEQLFKSVFIELDFHLEDWEVGLLSSPEGTGLVSELQMNRETCPTPVVFIEGDSMTIVDIPANIKTTHSVLKKFLDKHRGWVSSVSSGDESGAAEHPLVPENMEDTMTNLTPCILPHVIEDTMSNLKPSFVLHIMEDVIPNLKPRQLKVLSCAGALDRVCSKYEGVEVCVDADNEQAVLKAPQSLMKKVKTDLLYFLNVIRQVQVPLSPALRHMFERNGSKKWVQSVLCDSTQLSCVWEMCGDHIVISGPSSNILGFEQRLKSIFMEITVHLEEWEVRVLSPSVWTSFVDRHHRQSVEGVTPVLQLICDRVTIVHTAEDVDSIRLSLRQLLDEHKTVMQALISESKSSLSSVSIIEKCIPDMKTPQLNIVSNPKALSRLVKQHPGLVVCVNYHTNTVSVRAPDTIMDKALPSVACFLSLIQESIVPLTAALSEMWGKDGSREWVQDSLVDKYDLVCHWELADQSLVVHGHSRDIQRLEQMFKSVFKERRVDLTEDEASLLTCEWNSFLDCQDKEQAGGPSPVLQLHSRYVIIVGIPSRIDSCQVALQKFLKQHRKFVDVLPDATPCTSQLSSGNSLEASDPSVLETSTTKIHGSLVPESVHENSVPGGHKNIPNVPEKSIHNLKAAQIKVLSYSTALSTFYKKYPGLQISVDRDKMAVTIRAPQSILLKAVTEIVSFIKEVREVKVLLTPPLCEMFEKENSRAWVQETLIDKYNIVCHWEICDLHLLISAHSSKLFRLERLFQSVFKEMEICLQQWEAGLLTSSLWSSYITEIHKNREGIPTPVLIFDTDSDIITIVDIVAKVDNTKQTLRQLLDDLIK